MSKVTNAHELVKNTAPHNTSSNVDVLSRPPLPISTYSSSMRFVSPEEAREWLIERNLHNRSMKKANLRFLRNQMINDEFKSLNGQSIVFSLTGVLLDGQHRLQAMSDTNKGYWFNVVTGVPDDYFTTIDSGAKRSTGDAFDVRGVQYSAGISGTVTFYQKFKKSPSNIASSAVVFGITAKDTLAEYDANPELFQRLYSVGLIYAKKMGVLSGTQIAGFMAVTVLDSEFGDRAEKEFWEPLFTGDNMSPQIKMLRDKLISTLGQISVKTQLGVKLTWIASTYNNHFADKVISRLRYDPKAEFPKIK